MVSAVVAFNRGGNNDDLESEDGSEQLLTNDERDSSFRLNKTGGKKKGLFGGLFKRGKDGKQEAEYEPPSTPSTLGENSPLNVTVLSRNHDTADPYGVSSADTTISELTGGGAGGSHRRVEFDPSTKQWTKAQSLTPMRGSTGDAVVGEAQLSTPSTEANSQDGLSEDEGQTMGTKTVEDTLNTGTEHLTVGTSTNVADSRCGVGNVNDNVFARTLGLFDDLCQVPKLGGTNLEPQLAAAMKNRSGDSHANHATSTQGSATKTSNTSIRRPEWGTVPSEDDDYDDDTFLNSMETTVDDSTLSASRTGGSLHANSIQTQSSRLASNATKIRKLGPSDEGVEVEDGQTEAPTHENFEVVLDSSFFESKEASPKRKAWFAKKGKAESEPDTPKRENSTRNCEAEYDTHEPERDLTADKAGNAPDSNRRQSLVGRLSAAIRKPKSNKGEEISEEKKDDLDPAEVRRIVLPAADFDFVAEENWDADHNESLRGMEILHTDDERDSSDQLASHSLSLKPANHGNSWKDSVVNPKRTDPKASDSTGTKDKKSSSTDFKIGAEGKAKAGEETRELSEPAAKKESLSKESKRGKHKRNSSYGGFIAKLRLPKMRPRSQDDSQVKYGESKAAESAQQKLPRMPKPMWKAVEDPKSGRTYYYHRKTRETTWTKPVELIQAERLIAQAMARAAARKEANSRGVEISATGVPSVTPLDKVPEPTPAVASTGNVDGVETRNEGASGNDVATAAVAGSALKPPAVVETPTSAENYQRLDQKETEVDKNPETSPSVESPKKTIRKISDFDDNWEVKKEINRLLTCLQPPDTASVNKLMKEYEGNEGQLLRRLRDLVESQPFDEPFLDEPALTDDEPKPSVTVYSNSPMRESMSLGGRMRTGFTAASRTSATTRSSNKTQKIRNTYRDKRSIDPIIEHKSTMDSSISEAGEDPVYPERVPIVTRRRELKVEEFTDSRVMPETYDVSGRVVRGRLASDFNSPPEDQYYGDNEVDTYGTDSVSALSENDADYMNRKENFEHARRRALDDAIEREDWELAAALSEGMRPTGDYVTAHGKWTQSEMDKFISQNDWSAVSGIIAQMKDGRKIPHVSPAGSDEIVIPSPSGGILTSAGSATSSGVLRAPSRGKMSTEGVSAAEKRVGSRSQLQHKELLSESSWTSESSYDSEYDSEYS